MDTGGQSEPITAKHMEIAPLRPTCLVIRSFQLRAHLIRGKRVTNRDTLIERISPFTLLSWVPIVPCSETTQTEALGRFFFLKTLKRFSSFFILQTEL